MYIDGFLFPVPNARKDEYRDFEAKWWPTFRKAGAQTMVLGWGDDVPEGKHTDFRRAVDLHDGETVVFGWMTWPDKATRDAAYAAMMNGDDDGMDQATLPFDGKRMIYGGFQTVLMEGDAA
jgi:uncharacterized protein YbaA (DUF1428 family)